MDSTKIVQLAQLLRDSGDKVLNEKYKLTLSGQLLQALGDAFRVIVDDADELLMAGGNGGIHGDSDTNSFQVVSKYHNVKAPEIRDLQLIYDFVQKTRILCVTQFAAHETDNTSTVDITKFRNLRRLEICKLPVSRVRGIQKMRAHLQELRCVQSIDSVEEIISHCGGDFANGFAWNELHTVDFAYNRLRTVGSLEFVTALQHLNLSHNQIVSVDAIKWLKNLKYLNLSFNRLAYVPLLHVEAPRRLKTLILSNNHIEDMTGLSRLDALCELNMSDNYLLDHSALTPVSTLVALQLLDLSGNPLACHPDHRQTVAKYLHKNTASAQFLLDNRPLSKTEKSLTGKHQSILSNRPPFMSFSHRSGSGGISHPASMTSLRVSSDNTPASSVGSLRSVRMDDTVTMNKSTASTRKIRPRAVKIAEHPPGAEPFTTAGGRQSVGCDDVLKFDTCTAHLETKKQIEEMRQQLGDSWLQTHGARHGPEDAPTAATLADGDEPSNMAADCGTPVFSGLPDRIARAQTSTPIVSKSPTVADDAFDDRSTAGVISANGADTLSHDTSTDTAFKTAINITNVESSVLSDAAESHRNNGGQLDEPHAVDEDNADDADEPPSEPEDNEVVYIVTLQPHLTDMFLVVSEDNIREKDAITGRTVTRWAMSVLESCDLVRTDVLRLNFDTLNRDRRERLYHIETGPCQQLERFLRSVLARRPLSEMNQVLWRCVKCGTQFSREQQNVMLLKGAGAKNSDRCPSCGSTFLVEILESSNAAARTPPTVSAVANQVDQPPIRPTLEAATVAGSESHSSIGSAQSLNESSSCSRISKSGSFDSNRSVDGSFGLAGRCRRAADFAGDRRSLESDVEILSNPSQSSIEVLEYSASRKHSEEQAAGYENYAGLEAYQRSMATMSLDQCAEQISRLSVTTLDPKALTAATSVTSAATTATMTTDQQPTPTPLVSSSTTTTPTAPQAASHLTESSSSGSVTDSICTAYDQQHSPAPSGGGDSGAVTNSKPMLSSMLNGLFLSTNNLMSRSSVSAATMSPTKAQSTPTTSEPPASPFKFSFSEFDNVDHRLKLYLYQSVFEDDNEQLKWLVRGQILLEKPAADGRWRRGAAVFVMSTTKFYVLQIVGNECDEVDDWLKRQLSGTIDRVQEVRVLPWKIGLTLQIKGIGNVQLLMQDILRTDSLLLFFANNPLPDTCHLNYQPAPTISQRLLLTTDRNPLKMLAILTDCCCTVSDATPQSSNATTSADSSIIVPQQQLLGLVITETHLYLLETAPRWLAQPSNTDDSNSVEDIVEPVRIIRKQQMNNLVAAERPNDTIVRFVFLEEMQCKHEEWTCTFETANNASSTLDSVGQSWERLFGVPLAQPVD